MTAALRDQRPRSCDVRFRRAPERDRQGDKAISTSRSRTRHPCTAMKGPPCALHVDHRREWEWIVVQEESHPGARISGVKLCGRHRPFAAQRSQALRLSSLRRSGLAHVFDHPLASFEENRIVALGAVSIAPEGEIRIEPKRGFDFSLRFIEPAELHQSSGIVETQRGGILVQFDRAAIQIERVLVSAKILLGEGHKSDPNVSIRVARTGIQRLSYMALGFLGVTVVKLGETNERVRGG